MSIKRMVTTNKHWKPWKPGPRGVALELASSMALKTRLYWYTKDEKIKDRCLWMLKYRHGHVEATYLHIKIRVLPVPSLSMCSLMPKPQVFFVELAMVMVVKVALS
jgi:hypothetical protein